jgi:hypothetical protein
LAPAGPLHPGLAYEVMLGSRGAAAGAIPDAGVWRSFPDPLGRPELQGHHITGFQATRSPQESRRRSSLSSLPKARITLYLWGGTGLAAPAAGRSLKLQLKGRVDTIATLKGIRLSRLSKEAQAELRVALDGGLSPRGPRGSGPDRQRISDFFWKVSECLQEKTVVRALAA